MLSQKLAPLVRRGWSLATGFAGAHALNAGLAIVYTLVQTLVFARVLTAHDFSNAIAVVAVGLYLLPINQSVARANFVLLRERNVRENAVGGAPQAGAAFNASQIILGAVCLLAPFAIGVHSTYDYALLFSQLFFCLFSNIWYSEMQMTMMATGGALRFEFITLLRRFLNFATMGWLIFSRDFLWFNIALAVQTIVFHLYLLISVRRTSDVFRWPRGLRRAQAVEHLWRLWTSLQATFAEWLTLNAPYAVFTAKFGIGPGLIAMDVVMKLLRMVATVTRNLCEIALPRVSHAIFSGEVARARVATALVLAGGYSGAVFLGGSALFFEHQTFSLLLGPNNTVPAGAGAPAALALFSAVGFAAGSHLIGHAGAAKSIRLFMMVATVAAACFAAGVFLLPVTVLQTLWGFAISLAAVSVVSLFLLARLLSPGSERAAAPH